MKTHSKPGANRSRSYKNAPSSFTLIDLSSLLHHDKNWTGLESGISSSAKYKLEPIKQLNFKSSNISFYLPWYLLVIWWWLVVVLCSDDVMFVREQIYYLYCVNMVRQDI